MTPLDKNYLSLQFWNKIYQKNGTEFQAFFEQIMERTPGFQKIKPYGSEGDKGNDGYRVRFLSVTIDDLGKAVFGDQTIKVIRPEQLRKFNFPLTLSEDYGVAPQTALQLVAHFLIGLITDDAVLPSSAERIFVEIVSLFPTKQGRKALGRLLLAVAVQFVQKNHQRLILGFRVKEKLEAIAAFLSAYGAEEPLLL